MRIVVTAGGTGGHINPALVVAEECRSMQAKVLFVGGLYGPEHKRAADAGFGFVGLNVRGLDRSSLLKSVKSLAIFPAALKKAMKILSVFSPDVVVGAGGYASAPATVAATLKNIPLFLMEQNVYPGMVTRRLARRASRVFTSFEETKRWLPGADISLSGNPVRRGFSYGKTRTFGEEKSLLVMGGSQGAHSINMAMAEALPMLEKIPLKIFHQAGEREYEVVKAMYSLYKQHAVVEPYFENMHEIMNHADLAVARAGASTCAELNLSGLPAVLVPYPGAGGHQKLNAEALVAQGAAMMVDDAALNGETLAETVEELFTDREKLEMMSANSREMARPDAGRTIAREIIGAVEG